MKRNVHRFLSVLLSLALLIPVYNASAETQPFDVNAKSAILIDAGTGKVLYEKNIHEKLPPASVTKIMTMLLAMEGIDNKVISLDDKVTVSEYASKMGGTQLYLEAGESKTVEELMKGIAIRSANDASVALGEYIAGTDELFVKRMNERANELGMENTKFINANGLPADGHVSTAYDIALMSRELLKHKDIHVWLTTWIDTVVVGRSQSTQQLVNTNRLINTYKGANGIKTGYTTEALHCVSASATRGNTTLISVILAAPSSPIRFEEASKLLDYGFSNFNTVDVVKKDEVIGTVTVNKGKSIITEGIAKNDLKLLVKKGEENKIQSETVFPSSIKAPILKGDKLGEIIATINGEEVGRVDIISKETIRKASLLNTLQKMFIDMMQK